MFFRAKSFLISLSLLTTSAFIATMGISAAPGRAQSVLNPSPAQNSVESSGRPAITASFAELDGEQIQPESLQIYLNSEEVTDEAVITQDFFSYRPSQPLIAGEQDVLLTFTNTSGEQRQVSWNFNLESSSDDIAIESVTHNGMSQSIAAGESLLVTVDASPNAAVSVLLSDGRSEYEAKASETSPGMYVASIPLDASNVTDEARLLARMELGNEVRYEAASRPIVISSSASSEQLDIQEVSNPLSGTTLTPQSLKPEVISYNNGDAIDGRSFKIEGMTLPNATVEISGRANTELIGGFFGAQQDLPTKTVTADSDGSFDTTMSIPAVSPAGTVYEIKLIGISGDRRSATTTLELTQQ